MALYVVKSHLTWPKRLSADTSDLNKYPMAISDVTGYRKRLQKWIPLACSGSKPIRILMFSRETTFGGILSTA